MLLTVEKAVQIVQVVLVVVGEVVLPDVITVMVHVKGVCLVGGADVETIARVIVEEVVRIVPVVLGHVPAVVLVPPIQVEQNLIFLK